MAVCRHHHHLSSPLESLSRSATINQQTYNKFHNHKTIPSDQSPASSSYSALPVEILVANFLSVQMGPSLILNHHPERTVSISPKSKTTIFPKGNFPHVTTTVSQTEQGNQSLYSNLLHLRFQLPWFQNITFKIIQNVKFFKLKSLISSTPASLNLQHPWCKQQPYSDITKSNVQCMSQSAKAVMLEIL